MGNIQMTKLNAIHLSDIHYIEKEKTDLLIVKNALLADLKSLINETPDLKPNILFFTGDMVFDGTRADFDKSWNEFIQPIIDFFDIDPNLVFLCPGNHDIERDKIDKIFESGLKNELRDIQSVNEFVDTLSTKSEIAFSRLTSYYNFLKTKKSKYIIEDNPLYSTYAFEMEGFKIGVASYNSAWRSYGGKADYGKLIVGERSIDLSLNSLKDRQFKFAIMHHPFSYIEEFEQPAIQRIIQSSFQVLLHGHVHEHDVEFLKKFNKDQLLVITAGSVYNKREYHNGYGLISIDTDTFTGKIYLREYDDRARVFTPVSSYSPNGVIPFELEQENLNSSSQSVVTAQMRSDITKTINLNEFDSISQLSAYPKTLSEIFVEPVLAAESESNYLAREGVREGNLKESKLLRSKAETLKILTDILASGKDTLFFGKKEYGKTSLLRHIFRLYIQNSQPERERIPLLIDYRSLPSGRNRVLKAIKNSLPPESNLYIEQQLSEGNCLILIDNLEVGNKKNLEDLKSFANSFNKNRFILTIDESALTDMGIVELPDFGINFQKVYIHAFKRKQIKELIEKWYGDNPKNINTEELFDRINQGILSINLPRTPLIVSITALILEKDFDFRPINKASLLEKLIEITLEKLNPEELSAGVLDYRNKEDLLAHIAHFMDEQGNYKLNKRELFKEVENYFKKVGLSKPNDLEKFIQRNFIRKGILAEDDDIIYFRFGCFGGYFIAKYMQENKEFYDYVLYNSEDNFLAYSEELEYLTGLSRKNKGLIEFIAGKLVKYSESFFSENELDIDLDNLEKLQLIQRPPQNMSTTNESEAIKAIRDSRISDNKKEELLDLPEDPTEEEQKRIARQIPDDISLKFISALELHSVVVRNCELIPDIDFKKKHIGLSAEMWLKLLYIALFRLGDEIKNLDEEKYKKLLEDKNLSDENLKFEQLKELGTTIFPVITTMFFIEKASETLGTPKLEMPLEEEILNTENHIAKRLIYTLVYADHKLSGFLEKLNKITREVIGKSFYRTVLYYKLLYYYSFSNLSPKQRIEIEKIIAGITIKDNKEPENRKSEVITGLQKKARNKPSLNDD